MTAVTNAVRDLRAALATIDEHLPLLDDPANAMATAESAKKAAEEHKTQVGLQIRAAQADSERLLAESEQKLIQLKADFANQAKGLTDQITALQSRKSDLDSEVKALQSRHDSILASLESLKKKIA